MRISIAELLYPRMSHEEAVETVKARLSGQHYKRYVNWFYTVLYDDFSLKTLKFKKGGTVKISGNWIFQNYYGC